MVIPYALRFTHYALRVKRSFTNLSSSFCKSHIERKSACTTCCNLYVYIVIVIDARLNGSIIQILRKANYETKPKPFSRVRSRTVKIQIPREDQILRSVNLYPIE